MMPRTSPVELTVATFVVSLVQVAICVRSSDPVPVTRVAVNCWVTGPVVVWRETEPGVTENVVIEPATTITVA